MLSLGKQNLDHREHRRVERYVSQFFDFIVDLNAMQGMLKFVDKRMKKEKRAAKANARRSKR